MPTRITVGVSRKLGQPNFGSYGADCHIDFEIGGDPLHDHQNDLPTQIRKAFAVCRAEVERELAGNRHSEPAATAPPVSSDRPQGQSNGKSHSGTRTRLATEAQIRAIHAIASKAKVTLASHLQQLYGMPTPQQLTLRQASELIESLKSQLDSATS